MPIHRAVLLAVVILLIGADATSARSQADQAAATWGQSRSLTTEGNQASAKKLLRSYTAEGESGEEERGWGSSTKHPDTIFENLKLATTSLDDQVGAGAKWLKSVLKYRAKKDFPDYRVYATLQSTHSDGDIAVFFQSLKEYPKVKGVAEDLQKLQFKDWVRRDYSNHDVAELLGVRLSTSDPVRSAILSDYTMLHVGNVMDRIPR